MSFQEKLDSARALVIEHNAVIGGLDIPTLDPDKFIQCLKVAGGTTEERLKGFSYEEILSCMQAFNGIKPIALAKDIAKVFRGKDESGYGDKIMAGKAEVRPVSAKKADRMALRELVEHYDPEDADNAVGKRLKDVCKGQKFVVFSSGRTVDVNTTLKLLEEVKANYSGRESIEVGGEIREVYALGIVPDNFVDENPLYCGRPLRPDGVCDQTNRSWNGVATNIRQLIRIAIEIGNLKDISIEKAHDIMDVVMGDKAWEKLSQRYSKAVLEYKKREGLGTLPKLKLTLKGGGSESKSPFQQAKKVSWAKVDTTDSGYNQFYQYQKWVQEKKW